MRRHQGLHLEKRGRLGPTGGGCQVPPPPRVRPCSAQRRAGGGTKRPLVITEQQQPAGGLVTGWLLLGRGQPEEDTENRTNTSIALIGWSPRRPGSQL